MDLVELIRIGSLKQVEKVIESKGLPTDDKWHDYEALNAALQCGHQDVAKYLLSKNCRVSKTNENGSAPLHNAVILRDAELVDCILKKGASLVAVHADGNTPLHQAFIREFHEITDLLLTAIERTSAYTNVKNRYGLTHLHIACTRKKAKIIKKYLENGASVEDAVSNDSVVWAGYTALHFAVSFESSVATFILLEFNANRNAEDARKRKPRELLNEGSGSIESKVIMDALWMESDDFYDGQLSYNAIPYFHSACFEDGNNEEIEKFIELGTNVNSHVHSEAPLYPGYTALHFAVLRSRIDTVKFLLSRGAEVEQTDVAQMTPLHLALYKENPCGKSEIADLLFKHVVAKNIEDLVSEDENLVSFFHAAITRNSQQIVEHYLEDDEDINRAVMSTTPNFPEYAPLHFAVRYGHVKMAKFLIERGARVNQVSRHGTPLHMASELKHESMIQFLIANRAIARPYNCNRGLE